MAFICEKCHKRLYGNDGNGVHFFGSYPAEEIRAEMVFWYSEIYGVRYGPCEFCRKSGRATTVIIV